MSDSDSSASSDSEDLNTTGLIATRAKRSTAGNLYASLRANLDDDEIRKDLLAEEEDDVGDYEGSDKEREDDEDAFETSSDDEDFGPPGEGEKEDLEGERELKVQERAEARKKRSVKDARLKVSGLVRPKKRVRLAEGVKGGDGHGDGEDFTHAPKPKKKSERQNWIPDPGDGPVRQSNRAQTKANRESVHANLKESFVRSEKQRKVMKDTAERDKSKNFKHADLTQEERLKKCEKVERETAKELGRFEREEAERQRAREEALAKKRRRGVDGPVFGLWSGSVVWEGEKLKVSRVEHGSLDDEGLKEIGRIKEVAQDTETGDRSTAATTQTQTTPMATPSVAPGAGEAQQQSTHLTAPSPAPTQAGVPEAPVSWLQGIQEYAAQPQSAPTEPPWTHVAEDTPVNGFTPSAPALNAYTAPQTLQPTPQPQQQSFFPPASSEPSPQSIYHGWPPNSQSFSTPQHVPTALPPMPAPPLIREQAQRSLLLLTDFPELATASEDRPLKSRKTPTSTTKAGDPTLDSTLTTDPIKSLLLPDAYPAFTPQQSTYLVTKPRKKGLETTLPPAPAKTRCALTQWEAKFRDPKTGVGYADLHAYKALQRCLAGGCRWSAVLGAWVGPSTGVGMMGRAARGVPEGFSRPMQEVKVEGAT